MGIFHRIEQLLPAVTKPARYTGGELHQVVKTPCEGMVRFAFAFPDVYEVGMSHLGTRILYNVLNSLPEVWCERVFAPWVDMEKAMRENDIPLYTLESGTPLQEMDFVGFTLQYEMSYTNLLTMLDMGNIPLWQKERETGPFVVVGGPCAYNPEPIADFVDIVALGEGEAMLPELMEAYIKWKSSDGDRLAFLRQVAQIEGFYVPSLYQVRYQDDGTIAAVEPLYDDVPLKVRKRIVEDFDSAPWPEKPIVPYLEIVHDRVTMELFRGCTRGCRFCQAGMIYRPVREKSQETLMKLTLDNLKATGYDEVSLSSLSSGDYSQLPGLIREMVEKTKEGHVALSLPSLRIDAFAAEYMQGIEGQRKAGLTLAPEAGTQRLRDVINKNVSAEDLYQSVREAFQSGWERVKLYFMLGLPTETMEDVEGIAELARGVVSEYRRLPKEMRRRMVRVTVSTSYFVPKPHTPFQFCAQAPVEEFQEKQRRLRELLRQQSGVDYNWHDPKTSLMEAVFARGDRRLSQVLRAAYRLGCRFDGWAEQFRYDLWTQAFEECAMDPGFYALRPRNEEEIFPWDMLECGVAKEYLWQEYQKAIAEETTPDCRSGCQDCGLGDLCKGVAT